MNAKKLPILLAAIVLIAAQFACAAGEPALANVRMAKDKDGAQPATTFGARDTVYVVADLSNAAAGNQVTSRWYAENVPGVDPNFFIDESTIDVTDTTINLIYFFFEAPPDGWPAGTYKVEVYFNGALNSTVNFTIQ